MERLMGASVSGYWPGITQEQLESQPGFWQDCKAWGDWMAEREKHLDVLKALAVLRVEAVRTCKTAGMDDSQVQWVTPHALAADAMWLRHGILVRAPGTKRIIETYALRANGVDPVEQELAQDLLDVAAIARFAVQQGVPRMTLEVIW